ICFAVNFLSRFMQKAKELHWKHAKNLLAYVSHTRHRKLHLGLLSSETLEGYADASYGIFNDAHSQTGWLFLLYGSVVAWKSKKQDTVSQSTTEAEYVALASATKELLWLRQLLQDWGVVFSGPNQLYEDSQAVTKLEQSNEVDHGAKPLNLKYD